MGRKSGKYSLAGFEFAIGVIRKMIAEYNDEERVHAETGMTSSRHRFWRFLTALC